MPSMIWIRNSSKAARPAKKLGDDIKDMGNDVKKNTSGN